MKAVLILGLVICAINIAYATDCTNGEPGSALCGAICYDLDTYVCHNNSTLCPIGAPELCGSACYNSNNYRCCFGVNLAQANQPCPPIPECCGGAGPLIGSYGQRLTCYSKINVAPFPVNPTTGEPYIYYNPCSNPDTGKLGCTGVPNVESGGCRMCQLDPVNDIRCKNWVPSKPAREMAERSGAGFQCPCEVIKFLRETNPLLLPTIYRSDPVCEVPTDCIRPPPSTCSTDCGEGVCYDPTKYVCNPGPQLCPSNSPLGCGAACYSTAQYTCCPGNSLMNGPNASCPDNTITEPGCCPAGEEYLGTPAERSTCYDFAVNPNPTTGEPYIYYNPCTPNGDQTMCISGPAREAGCRECFLDPVNDIRCPGTKRTGPGAKICPCDIITHLFEKNPLLLPAIYRRPAVCKNTLPVPCQEDALYGGASIYQQATSPSAAGVLASSFFVALFSLFAFLN